MERDDGFIVTEEAHWVSDSEPDAIRVDPGDGLAAQLLGFYFGMQFWIAGGPGGIAAISVV